MKPEAGEMGWGEIRLNLESPIPREESAAPDQDLAIIGMAASFPGADSLESFWRMLAEGRHAFGPFPSGRAGWIREHLRRQGADADACAFHPGAYFDRIDLFDHGFFGIPPREAGLMSPAQRIFMQTAWHALEDAGYADGSLRGSDTGIFLGHIGDLDGYQYKEFINAYEPNRIREIAVAGNLASVMPARISHFLDWHGPSLLIDTSCSSSLVALHMACRSVLSGDCTMAMVASVRLNLMPLDDGFRLGIESLSGSARPFQEEADGTVAGEGSVAILIKPLRKAMRAGDRIRAIIRGSAVNHDGHSAGLTAPNPRAQAELLARAWSEANVAPGSISFLEAHGTATYVGDPIEVEGMVRAFGGSAGKSVCAVGSVKANIGHLYQAAGLAGVVKACLCFEKGMLPPIAGFLNANRKAGFEGSAVFPLDTARAWGPGREPRRCGVSSFGISGTNCHVVLQEPPAPASRPGRRAIHLFTLSARTQEALDALIGLFSGFLAANPPVELGDICFTLARGRTAFAHRLAIVAEDLPGLRASILSPSTPGNGRVFRGTAAGAGIATVMPSTPQVGESELFGSEAMARMAAAFAGGACLDWRRLYPDGDWKRVGLPLYPFAKHACWLSTPEASEASGTGTLLHKRVWTATPAPLPDPSDGMHQFLLMDSPGALRAAAADSLRAEGARFIDEAGKADALGRGSHWIFVSGADAAGAAASWKESEQRLESGVHALAARILAAMKGSAGLPAALTLIVGHAHAVLEGESAVPEESALAAFGRNVARENPGLIFREIDWDGKPMHGSLLGEISAAPCGPIAFRNGRRFQSALAPLDRPAPPYRYPRAERGGTVLITGGTGAIGLEMARYLAERGYRDFTLLGRRPFEVGTERHRGLTTQLAELEKTGAKVRRIAADVSDPDALAAAMDDARSASGSIRGILHCAGELSFGLFGNQGEGRFRASLAAKTRGTWLLHNLAKQEREPLEFFILFSSLSALYPVPGFSGYAVANAYQDGFAEAVPGVASWNWAEWKGMGIAGDFRNTGLGDFHPLEASHRRAALDILWESFPNRVMIGYPAKEGARAIPGLPASADAYPEPARIRRNIRSCRPAAIVRHSRGNLPVMDTREAVASICAAMLGLESIGVEDNLLEMGADSILLARIHDALQERFPGRLTVSHMFALPTIAKLADFLDRGPEAESGPQRGQAPAASAESILDGALTGSLSLGEAVKALMARRA